MSSFGDWIALSDKCDATCARLIAREVSDGIIAPDYDEEALAILKGKRKGGYNIIKIDPAYVPAEEEKEAGIWHYLQSEAQRPDHRRKAA